MHHIDEQINALRTAVAAIARSAGDFILTDSQCEDLSSISEQLHTLAEASWNRHLAMAQGSDQEDHTHA